MTTTQTPQITDNVGHTFSGPHDGCDCPDCTYQRANGIAGYGLIAVDPTERMLGEQAHQFAHRFDNAGPAGTGRRTSVEGPSERQVAFIKRLAAERGIEAPVATSKRDASKVIDRLLAMPKPTAVAEPGAPAVGRWAKVSGQWCVRLAGVNTGDTVTVRNGAGVEKVVVLGSEIQADTYTVAPTPKAERVAAVDCPEGMHQTADGTIYKVYRTQTTGNLAAKRLHIIPTVDEDGEPKHHGEFTYEAGAIRKHTLGESTKLSQAEAARFGQVYSFCCACGRDLDDERSLHAGYGPKCAARNGWDWGTKQRVGVPTDTDPGNAAEAAMVNAEMAEAF